jgi:hypothetical protein
MLHSKGYVGSQHLPANVRPGCNLPAKKNTLAYPTAVKNIAQGGHVMGQGASLFCKFVHLWSQSSETFLQA